MNFIKKTISRLQIFFKYRELFLQLISRDIKLKYRRSVLGYLWTVLNPLLTMIILVIVFSNIFSRNIPNYPIYLLIGQMSFHFMTGAISNSLSSVTGNASLLKKIYIPKYIFTLADVTSELLFFFFSLGAFVVVVFATSTPVTWRILLAVIPIVELYIFCIGLGLFMSQAAVFFRDIVYIWHVVSLAWMYLSVIFYPVSILPDKVRYFVTHYNPMYFYITMFRNFTLGGANMGNLDLAIRGSVAAVIMMIVGLVCFSYNKNKFILYL